MKCFIRTLLAFALLTTCAWGAGPAKNVILFLGDAAGIPTLQAASIRTYNKPAALFIQHMPHLALSDTSSAFDWVSDSAAGMTAIVTGQKTRNGVLSQSAEALPGKQDGTVLKTILEYAEEHGLSTGVVSNSPMDDATPAACYAHANSRQAKGMIFAQVLKPAFGDGVDVIIGPGRTQIVEATKALGIDILAELPKHGYAVGDSLAAIPKNVRRAVILMDVKDHDVTAATQAAIEVLSRNPKGFFLMVESDLHTDDLVLGLDRAVAFDKLIQATAERMTRNTLVLFTADHSFDLRIAGSASKDRPLITLSPEGKAVPVKGLTVGGHHAAEQVLVSAQGPGADQVHGFITNTDLFGIMLRAYGWQQAKAAAAGK